MIEEQYSPAQNLLISVFKEVNQAAKLWAQKSGVERSEAIKTVAKALENRQQEILEANTLDLETSREMAIPEIIQEWLRLTPERIQRTIELLKKLSRLGDPIGQIRHTPYTMEACQTYCQLMPLGVIALVYEALPELSIITAGFCLKTGNSLILRGSSEASQTNRILFEVLQEGLEKANFPENTVKLVLPEEGTSLQDFLGLDNYFNLIIPYGRKSLIEQVTQQATIPVLRTAIGNCYLYCSVSGDLELVYRMIVDSHSSEPDRVNAIEKVLIASRRNLNELGSLFKRFKNLGFQLKGESNLVYYFPEQLQRMEEEEWGRSYLKKTISFKLVENLGEGINWINQYSSGHADCIVTASYQESQEFAQGINSALIYINSSPRFLRNPKQGESVFLGISNQKGQRRGLISLESLTTLKQVVQGNG